MYNTLRGETGMNKRDLKELGQYLHTARNKLGLSIRQLEELSGISNAYISQIENGKRNPSPKVLKKLSKPLNLDYGELLKLAGYNDLHKETVSAIKNNDIDDVITAATSIFLSAIREDEKKENIFKTYLLEQLQEMYSLDENVALELINKPKFLISLIENLTLDEKIRFLDILIKEIVDNDLDPKEIICNQIILSKNSVSTIRVPILGYIAAGNPIFADEHIEEWMEIPNMWNLKEGEVIVLRVKGDSMIGSRIYDGDKVVVKLQSKVENGDIAVVNVNGDEATLKRVKMAQNGQIILYPDNPKYEPVFVNDERARIIGKVIQVMFEPK